MTFEKMRHKMGLTQTQVSKIFGIPYSTIQKWEHGICVPPDYVLKMMWELYQLKGISNMIGGKNG